MSRIIHRKTPEAEVIINETVIRSLLWNQFPDLHDLDISFVDAGWDNEMYRLGEKLCIRLPRREVAVDLMKNERHWLPSIEERVNLQVPTPIHLGDPDENFPWIWNIIPWFDGTTAEKQDLGSAEPARLSKFLRQLHIPAPPALSTNWARMTLPDKKEQMKIRLDSLKQKTNFITPHILELWEAGLNADSNFEATFIHADLHPRNILVNDHKITSIIDWGDMTSGDVAIDLAAIWTVFKNKEERAQALTLYGPDQNQILKAKAWAVFMGVIMLDTGLTDNPVHANIGKIILRKMNTAFE